MEQIYVFVSTVQKSASTGRYLIRFGYNQNLKKQVEKVEIRNKILQNHKRYQYNSNLDDCQRI